jgi:hypothetical protein
MASIVTVGRIYSSPKAKDEERIVSATYTDPKTKKVSEGEDHQKAYPNAPKNKKDRETPEYGFKTSNGRIVSRKEAYGIAKKADQLKSLQSNKILHTSNLKQNRKK